MDISDIERGLRHPSLVIVVDLVRALTRGKSTSYCGTDDDGAVVAR